MKRLIFVLLFSLSVFAGEKADKTMVFLTVKDYFKNVHYSQCSKPSQACIAEISSNYEIKRGYIRANAKVMVIWRELNHEKNISAKLKIKVVRNKIGVKEYTVVSANVMGMRN